METAPVQDGRLGVVTDRPDGAAALLQQVFPGMTAEIHLTAPVLVDCTMVQADPLRLAELRVRGTAVLRGSGAAGRVSAGVVLGGRLDAEYPRHRLETARPFLRPGGPAVLTLRDVHLRLVDFDGDRFRLAAERGALGRAGPRLLRTRPVDDEAADAWRWAAACIHDSLTGPSTPNTVVLDELFELGVRVLLASFGERTLPAGAAEVRGAPTAVRRAVAYLEAHASGAVTVPEVAAAARVSPRSLQALFRRHLGVTPIAHLHAIRLDAARRDLLEAGGSSTVHEIAVRWGFGNSGRFARLYAERFGERPSETLRLG